MANMRSNVTTGKPKKTGAIFVAPLGTTLPTTAADALDQAFKCLGYVSDDGVTNSNSKDTETIKAWGGDPVLSTQNDKQDTWKFKLIEATNVDVLKLVYGADNVSGELASGISIKANSEEQDPWVVVIDMVFKSSMKRVVLPAASVAAVGDIVYADVEAVGYDTTLTAMPDEEGNTHYEYIKAA